ncbi:MAG TPA: transketolase [Candidatus Pullichristensenella excrementigallinarum]|uniref:Transketolase n=1 Tax=Candidatus Pullichristensenella excrementigallinarum TaxID=2840907 RepID=A0A9D1IBU7_9FIRM|nr:transketolase [Candidatus Pullichristensenella excrementigallinarum]
MTNEQHILEMKKFANDIRILAIKMIGARGAGHVGGCMSLAETMSVLYNGMMRVRPEDPKWPDRDKIVVSKGHAGPIMYAALAKKGFFPMDWLETLNLPGTKLPSHTDRLKTPGVDMTTGSLGQGSSTACGLAQSEKILQKDTHVFLILGDGEINEGQVWEAMMYASSHHLTNLIVMVDSNKAQVDGFCKDVCDMGDLAAKFESFGLKVINVEDGNDVAQVWNALEEAKKGFDRPVCVLLNTIKGKDLPIYEGDPACHYIGVSAEQLASSVAHLEEIGRNLEKEGK